MGDFVHGPQRLLHPHASHRAEGLRAVRADLVGRGAGRDPRPGQRGHRPLGPAGGDAAELCRPARLPGRRQHVAAVLQPAGRDAALSPRAVRRRAQRGLGGDLRRRGRMPAGIRRACEAQRRLGQQRDRRQSAPRALHPPCEAQGRQAGRGRSVAHEDRRAGRSASAAAARHRRVAGLVRGGGARTNGRVRRRLHRRQRAGGRGVHGAGARNGRRRGRRRHAACRRARS